MKCMIGNAEDNVEVYKESNTGVMGMTSGSRLWMTPKGTRKGLLKNTEAIVFNKNYVYQADIEAAVIYYST